MASPIKAFKPAFDTAKLSFHEGIVFLLACLSSTFSYLASLSHRFLLPTSASTRKPHPPSRRTSLACPRPPLRRSSSSTTAICYSPRNSMCENSPTFPIPPLPSSPPPPQEYLDAAEGGDAETVVEEDLGIAPEVELFDSSFAPSKRDSGIWVERIVVEEVVVVSSS